MAEQRPSSQADEQEENAQLVEPGSDDWGMYRDNVGMGWDGIRKGKAQIKWELVRDVKKIITRRDSAGIVVRKERPKRVYHPPHPL